MITPPKMVLALGEVLWDVFPNGPRFGGAPANFACCVAELGQERVSVALASAVGNDDLGRQASRTLQELGVATKHVASCPIPTGQVLVQLDAEGRASYSFVDNPAWDHVLWKSELATAARAADIVYFGTLGQRSETSRQTIQKAVQVTSLNCLRIVDINLRPPFWNRDVIVQSLTLANVLKLNDEELPMVAEMLDATGTDEEILRGIMNKYSLRAIALTRGANGSLLLSHTGERSHVPGVIISVVDTVGAGDSFTAALALGLSHGLPLEVINRWATDVAAFVCTQAGGTPRIPAELRLTEVLTRP